MMQLDHVTVPVPAGKIHEVHAFYGGVIGLEMTPLLQGIPPAG